MKNASKNEELKHIAREFNRIDKELDDLYHEIALKIGISDSALVILYFLEDLGDGCTQRDICDRAFISKQTTHSSIRRLEEEGYLYLKQGKGKDKHIYLTEKGKKFTEKYVSPVMKMEEDSFGDMDRNERAQYLALAEKYASSFAGRVRMFNPPRI